MKRISLGSGLDRRKLADTIRQISDAEPPLPRLICFSPELDHIWLSLTAETDRSAETVTLSGWVVTAGYPGQDTAVLHELTAGFPPRSHLSIDPASACVMIHLPGNISIAVLADIITATMFQLHNLSSATEIETALEFR